MKIGMIGSFNYQNATRIKEMLIILRDSIGDDLVIYSGGGYTGAEKIVRKYCLEFNIKYKEFNPACTPYNGYSAMPPEWYGKPKHGTHYIHRYDLLVSGVDKLVLFIPKGEDVSFFKSVLRKAEKKKIKAIIVH